MIDDVIDFLYTSYKDLDKEISREAVKKFLLLFRHRVIIARDKQDKIAACAFYLKDKDTLNFLFIAKRNDFEKRWILKTIKELIKIHSAKSVRIYHREGYREYVCKF